jgi:Na+-transporting NADH:ubiquinone oxidoreductase subunit C
MKAEDVLNVYETKIQELVIDQNGAIVEGKLPKDIGKEDNGLHPLYIYKEGDEIISYAFPVVGQGLWSALYGYLAIESDAITIRGITFYKHGETPGLGGEIEKDWFQKNFVGKKIYSVKDQKLTPIAVVKGKANEIYKDDPAMLENHVDGITAATLTCNGVTDMMDKWVRIYDAYLSKHRKS